GVVMRLNFVLNGEEVSCDAAPDALLLDVIRDLGHTGTKEGCAVGVCGACTVLVRELPVCSCLYLAAMAEGAEVWSVEGIAERDPALIECFVDREGMQCGICTPGQVVSAFAFGLDHAQATDDEIRRFMSGNLCRCTGYVTITEAVRSYLDRR
ncbi:MAG: (2Fe-2S)-binding protein, partial [Acidimicrobiaceae bacterium]|nr:(2Fe-2S)-binding protein [Acidimicrobiaceae bacterium]